MPGCVKVARGVFIALFFQTIFVTVLNSFDIKAHSYTVHFLFKMPLIMGIALIQSKSREKILFIVNASSVIFFSEQTTILTCIMF